MSRIHSLLLNFLLKFFHFQENYIFSCLSYGTWYYEANIFFHLNKIAFSWCFENFLVFKLAILQYTTYGLSRTWNMKSRQLYKNLFAGRVALPKLNFKDGRWCKTIKEYPEKTEYLFQKNITFWRVENIYEPLLRIINYIFKKKKFLLEKVDSWLRSRQ